MLITWLFIMAEGGIFIALKLSHSLVIFIIFYRLSKDAFEGVLRFWRLFWLVEAHSSGFQIVAITFPRSKLL